MGYRNVVKIIAVVLVLMDISGCAGSVKYKTAMSSYAGVKSCCKTMAQFHYGDIKFGENPRITLNAASDAFDFPTGKSYFAAFRLPPGAVGHMITVQSYGLGIGIDMSHIFYPQIDILDDEYHVIAQSRPQDFILSRTEGEAPGRTWDLSTPLKLEGHIKLNKPAMRYMVIYTTKDLLGSKSTYKQWEANMIPLPVAPWVIPLGTGTHSYAIPHSPFGILYVELGNTTR